MCDSFHGRKHILYSFRLLFSTKVSQMMAFWRHNDIHRYNVLLWCKYGCRGFFIGRWLLIPRICSDLVKVILEPRIVFSFTHNVSQRDLLMLHSISKCKTVSGSSLQKEHRLDVLIFQFFNWILVIIALWSSLYWNSRSFGLFVQERAILKSSIKESLLMLAL